MRKIRPLAIAFILYMCIALVGISHAQSLTIKGKVLLENKSTLEPIEVKILNLANDEVQTISVIRAFNHVLPYNGQYLIIVSREGYQPKSIYIDTECNNNHPFKYVFSVDLKPKEVQDDIPIAVGGIYYNKKDDEFTYYKTN